MSETSGFFEAQWDDSLTNPITEEKTGWWDRDYLASQWMEFMQMFLGNGVFVSPVNQCKVIPGTGMSVMVTPGWAFINGAWYHNDENLVVTIPNNTTSSARIDSIKLRYSEATRAINVVSASGSTTVTRGDSVYELKLAEVTVDVGAVTISASKITDTRSNENVCGFVKGLVEVVDTNDLFTQFTDMFNNWFDDVKGQITGDLGAKLQLEFTQLNNNVEKYQTEVNEQVETANNLVEGYVYNDYVTDELTFTFVNKSCEVSDSRVTLNTLLDLYFTDDTIQEAEDCQITIDSGVGKYILKAVKQPSKSLKGRIRVRINSTIPQLPEEFDEYATKSYVTSNYYNKTEIEPALNFYNMFSNSGAGFHNSLFRGKNLGTEFTSEQLEQIVGGMFDDLFIGDYWTINNVVYRIAGFDIMLHNGDTELTKHHIVIVPDKNMYTHVMNDTNVTTGGYYNSKMKQSGLNNALTTIKTAFGESHVITRRPLLTNAVNGDNASGGGWYDSQIDLMTERQVYGSPAWGQSSHNGYDASSEYSRFPLFTLAPQFVCNRSWYWLRDVRSSADFTLVAGYGDARGNGASAVGGVRPFFLLG